MKFLLGAFAFLAISSISDGKVVQTTPEINSATPAIALDKIGNFVGKLKEQSQDKPALDWIPEVLDQKNYLEESDEQHDLDKDHSEKLKQPLIYQHGTDEDSCGLRCFKKTVICLALSYPEIYSGLTVGSENNTNCHWNFGSESYNCYDYSPFESSNYVRTDNGGDYDYPRNEQSGTPRHAICLAEATRDYIICTATENANQGTTSLPWGAALSN